MFTIEFILPYRNLRSVVEKAFEEHPHHDEMAYVISYIGAPEVVNHTFTGDVLIARGLTAVYLNHLLKGSFTVLELPMTGYDILRAVYRGNKRWHAKKTAVILTGNALYAFDNFLCNLEFDVVGYEIQGESESEGIIQKAIDEGADLIVGGDQVVTVAERCGLHGMRIEADKESVRQVIDEAWHLHISTQEERLRSQRLKALVENVNEGILLCDSEKRVIICNHFALQLLHRSLNEVIGMKIAALQQGFDTPDFATLQEPSNDVFLKIAENELALSRIPIRIRDVFENGIIVLQKLSQIQKTEIEIRRQIHKKGHFANYHFANILGEAPALEYAKKSAATYAKVQANVLLIGETGTGKEMFAQSIHNASARKDGPFVAVNCAALPDSLLESELFGYVGGAFTGASKNGKIGLFELAHGGTLFLDEISEMGMLLQGRLLRVIEEREIMRIGDDKVIPVDIRIIAATNRNLEAMIGENKFRNDLYYRLNVLALHIPSLAERIDDIQLLVPYFLAHYDAKNHLVQHMVAPEVIPFLKTMGWPGNVRQLRNFCERLSVLVESSVVTCKDAERCLGVQTGAKRHEAEILQAKLAECGGNKKLLSEILHIDRSTLYRRLKRLGL